MDILFLRTESPYHQTTDARIAASVAQPLKRVEGSLVKIGIFYSAMVLNIPVAEIIREEYQSSGPITLSGSTS